jgi:hypothetical protein
VASVIDDDDDGAGMADVTRASLSSPRESVAVSAVAGLLPLAAPGVPAAGSAPLPWLIPDVAKAVAPPLTSVAPQPRPAAANAWVAPLIAPMPAPPVAVAPPPQPSLRSSPPRPMSTQLADHVNAMFVPMNQQPLGVPPLPAADNRRLYQPPIAYEAAPGVADAWSAAYAQPPPMAAALMPNGGSWGYAPSNGAALDWSAGWLKNNGVHAGAPAVAMAPNGIEDIWTRAYQPQQQPPPPPQHPQAAEVMLPAALNAARKTRSARATPDESKAARNWFKTNW